MKSIRILIATICTVLAAATVNAEEIVLSAGSGPLDSVINPVKESFEKDTGIRLTILFGSASLAFKQFYKGVAETAAVGTGFDEILEILKKEGFEIKDSSSLRHVTIGRGMIRTIVHKSNPVSKLSKEQLKGIFSGRITNWKEVGGIDSPIIVILSNLNPATISTFKKIILDNEAYSREVLELGHMDELSGAVEVNPEAITFGSSAVLSSRVKPVETPEIIRPVTLITKGAPSLKIQKLIDYILTGPGKSLVKE